MAGNIIIVMTWNVINLPFCWVVDIEGYRDLVSRKDFYRVRFERCRKRHLVAQIFKCPVWQDIALCCFIPYLSDNPLDIGESRGNQKKKHCWKKFSLWIFIWTRARYIYIYLALQTQFTSSLYKLLKFLSFTKNKSLLIGFVLDRTFFILL